MVENLLLNCNSDSSNIEAIKTELDIEYMVYDNNKMLKKNKMTLWEIYDETGWEICILNEDRLLCKLTNKDSDKVISTLGNYKNTEVNNGTGEYIQIKNITNNLKLISGAFDIWGLWICNKIRFTQPVDIKCFRQLLLEVNEHYEKFKLIK